VALANDRLENGGEQPDEAAIREACLGKNVEAPNMVTIKDFRRFYILSSKGRLSKHVSVESIVSFAEWFFAGFLRVTGTDTKKEDRTEVVRVSISNKRDEKRRTLDLTVSRISSGFDTRYQRKVSL
jgi:hypothetical protein